MDTFTALDSLFLNTDAFVLKTRVINSKETIINTKMIARFRSVYSPSIYPRISLIKIKLRDDIIVQRYSIIKVTIIFHLYKENIDLNKGYFLFSDVISFHFFFNAFAWVLDESVSLTVPKSSSFSSWSLVYYIQLDLLK